MKIPEEVKILAEEEGRNSVSYVGTKNGIEYYSICIVDEYGNIEPTGLPVIISYKNGKTKIIDGIEALHLLPSN